MFTKHTHSSTTTHVHVVRNTDSKSLHPDRIIIYADHMSQRSLPPTFLPVLADHQHCGYSYESHLGNYKAVKQLAVEFTG